jgi:hypothetical protein
MRLSYLQIVVEANRLMLKDIVLYHLYLEAVGWTDQEFDQELLKRIDEDWDYLTSTIRKINELDCN